MRVLVADKLHPKIKSELENLCSELIYEPGLKAEQLSDHLQEVDALVVRSTKVTTETLNSSQARSLSLIVRAGAGVNTIDVDRASELGIAVCNCPGKNAVAVAELAVGLLLSIDRRIPDGSPVASSVTLE